MSTFKRGIENQNFIDALKSSSYFQEMVSHKDLFIAIRNEYINVYYYGQSICKIEFVNNKIKWTTHKKYLGTKQTGYADTGVYLEKIDELKQNAREYKLKEKEQVAEHVLWDKDRCIIDIEVGFGNERVYIDYVAVEKTDTNRIKLVFYEAKHFDNSEIRATEEPKVFGQIKKYEQVLTTHNSEILDSYKTIYENIKALNLSNKDKLIGFIGEIFDNVEIDHHPKLIIFEVDLNRKGRFDHIERLREKLGVDRLILKYK